MNYLFSDYTVLQIQLFRIKRSEGYNANNSTKAESTTQTATKTKESSKAKDKIHLSFF
jgi:hypothetical protein